jgi:hypothetical protein
MLFFYIGNNEIKQYSPEFFLFYYHKATYFLLRKKTKNNDARDGKIRRIISSTNFLRILAFLRKKYLSYRKNFFIGNFKNEI